MKITISEAIALLQLAQSLVPQIKKTLAGGEVSADEQAKLKAAVDGILNDYNTHFSGSHWQVRKDA